jgi:hypothetical protein
MSTLIEFGSHHHGCNDLYSDRDIFILYDKTSNIFDEKKGLKRKGYSVTAFSKDRAKYLSKIGNLFTRHVFFEGKVIQGSKDDLEYFRNIWSPASNYNFEIEDNKDLLSILETSPSTIESRAAINDILVCSLRNVLIRKIANEGLFVFSWTSVLSEGTKMGFINENDSTILRLARRYKNIYRQGLIPKIRKGFINLLEEITQKVIDTKRKIKFGTHKQITSLPEQLNDGTYSQLRAIELLCSHYGFDKNMKKYSELVKDPTYFCNFGSTKALQRKAN